MQYEVWGRLTAELRGPCMCSCHAPIVHAVYLKPDPSFANRIENCITDTCCPAGNDRDCGCAAAAAAPNKYGKVTRTSPRPPPEALHLPHRGAT
eukprot:366232-Chlamydomonas_euryale.AAC.2